MVDGLAIVGIAMALSACGSFGSPAASSPSRPAVVTTLPGEQTCEGHPPKNDASPDENRQAYAGDIATPLKDKLKTYDSAVQSGDAKKIGGAASALGAHIRSDGKLVDIPRMYGCYDPKILARVQNAADAFAATLDALSCAADNVCNRKQTEIPALTTQAAPQERAAIEAFNAYAAQFGGERLLSSRTSAVPPARQV